MGDEYDDPGLVYVGNETLDCLTCDELASSVSPLYRKPLVKSKLKYRKFRPWARRKDKKIADGRQCYICLLAARKAYRSRGGAKYLQFIKKSKCLKLKHKKVVTKFVDKLLQVSNT